MNGSRFWMSLIWLPLTLTSTPTVWSQQPKPEPIPQPCAQLAPQPLDAPICKLYQLRDISESDDVREWIRSTVPKMVQPGTWHNQSSGPGYLTYDAKSGLLAIRHTAAVHAEVDEFLKKVKSTIKEPAAVERKIAARPGNVMPAQFGVIEAARSDPASQGYPVPAPLQQPKHLFHFIIRFEGSGMETAVADLARKLTSGDADSGEAAKDDAGKAPLNQLLHLIVRYEGDGIIDPNVVEFMKAYARLANQEKEKGSGDPLVGEIHPSTPSVPPSAPVGLKKYYGPPPILSNPSFEAPAPMGPPPSSSGPTMLPMPSSYDSQLPKAPNKVNLYLEQSRAAPSQARPAAAAPGILQVGTSSAGQEIASAKKQPLSLEDIVRMTRSGVSPSMIVNQINATGSTFELSSDDIDWLSLQGVSRAVLAYMHTRTPGNGGPHTSPMGPLPSSE